MKYTLDDLRKCKNRRDLATLLGYDYQVFCRILYQHPIHRRYTTILIPKKNSNTPRVILSPDGFLKNVQRKLCELLEHISDEINISKNIYSFAFKKNSDDKEYGIYKNALPHINKKIVINLDLKDFFENITFPRIVGYFTKNKNFLLSQEVAITIAQIACYSSNNKSFLPQGSPVSPILSNMIGEILDAKITKLINKYKFEYTRYADDLTLSFKTINVPKNIIFLKNNEWNLGKSLREAIQSSGFEVNPNKFRVKSPNERQTVTGLSVNKKVNINKNYYKYSKAIALAYCKNNEFKKSKYHIFTDKEETYESLIGILNYIKYIKNREDLRLKPKEARIEIKKPTTQEPSYYLFQMNSFDRLYLKVLFQRNFVFQNKINIICEGKTDPQHINIFLKNSKKFFKKNYNVMAFKEEDPSFFSKELRIQGGTGSLCRFIDVYSTLFMSTKSSNLPTILLVDSDDAGDRVFAKAEKRYPKTFKSVNNYKYKIRFAHVLKNLFIIQLPKKCGLEDKEIKCMEQMYAQELINYEIDGKKVCLDNKGLDTKKFLTKDQFVKHVINSNSQNINYTNFNNLFELIDNIQYTIYKHAEEFL